MKIITTFSAIFLFTFSVFGQTLKADYQFQGTLESSVAGAPALTNLTGSEPNSFVVDAVDRINRQTLRFSFNGGVALFNTASVIPSGSYTLVALFKFDDYNGYKRVIDFKNGTSQTGAYLLNGRFEAEPVANPAIEPTRYVQAVLTRDVFGRVKAYRDGVLRVDIGNDGGLYLISSANVLRFAQDDLVMGGQASAGNLARIRLYDAPLTDLDAQILSRYSNSQGELEGRVVQSSGKPVRNAYIAFTEANTNIRRAAQTNAFGYFRIYGFLIGRPQSISLRHKRFTFPATGGRTFYSPTNTITFQTNE